MTLPYGQTVIVHRYARDAKGDRVQVSQHEEHGVGRAPSGGYSFQQTESNARGETVIADEVLYGPHSMDVGARDVVEFPDGSLWEVDGDPGQWKSPLSGWSAGTVVNVKRVEG